MIPQILREDGEDTLRVVVNDHMVGLTIGSKAIASSEPFYSSYLVKIFAKIDAEERQTAKIAHLGGGMAWLAKMLVGYGYEQDVYEIDPDIVSFLQEGILQSNLNFIVGDYKDTLSGMYDIIIYDIDEPLEDENLLHSHLNEGGKIYKLTD